MKQGKKKNTQQQPLHTHAAICFSVDIRMRQYVFLAFTLPRHFLFLFPFFINVVSHFKYQNCDCVVSHSKGGNVVLNLVILVRTATFTPTSPSAVRDLGRANSPFKAIVQPERLAKKKNSLKSL